MVWQGPMPRKSDTTELRFPDFGTGRRNVRRISFSTAVPLWSSERGRAKTFSPSRARSLDTTAQRCFIQLSPNSSNTPPGHPTYRDTPSIQLTCLSHAHYKMIRYSLPNTNPEKPHIASSSRPSFCTPSFLCNPLPCVLDVIPLIGLNTVDSR